MCLWLCTTSVHNTTQNSSDNLPSYLQTNIIAQMLSIGGEGVSTVMKTCILVDRVSLLRREEWVKQELQWVSYNSQCHDYETGHRESNNLCQKHNTTQTHCRSGKNNINSNEKQTDKSDKTEINQNWRMQRSAHSISAKLDLGMSYKHPMKGVEVRGAEAHNPDWLDQLKTDKMCK